MCGFITRIVVGLLTFAAGVILAAVWVSGPGPRAVGPTPAPASAPLAGGIEAVPLQAADTPPAASPEEKAVRLAEEFVARNGYTDLLPDKENLSYETVEEAESLDEMLRFRHDTLERKAYGIRYASRMEGPGWTVVFRHSRRCGNTFDAAGRAVTMDENFESLLLEHKSFPLVNVQKKF